MVYFSMIQQLTSTKLSISSDNSVEKAVIQVKMGQILKYSPVSHLYVNLTYKAFLVEVVNERYLFYAE